MKCALRGIALVLVLVGTATLLVPSMAFSSVDADRTTNVSVADDQSNALLGMTQLVSSIGGTTSVARITNNLDEDLNTLDTAVSLNTTDLSINQDFDNSLLSGDSTDLVLDCEKRSGTATVNISVNEASGPDVTITDPSLNFTVDYDCTGKDSGGDGPGAPNPVPIEETGLEVSGGPVAIQGSKNPDSVVEFDLDNTGSEVTITGIEIRDTTSNATKVSNSGQEITITSTTDGSLDKTGKNTGLNVGGGRYDLDSNATVASGATASFSLDEFRESGNGNNNQVDMEGEDVDIVLYFQDRDPVILTLEDIKQG